MALTRKMLDATDCGSPGCAHDHSVLYFVARCHQDAGVAAFYDKRDGVLRLQCYACGAAAMVVEVARGLDS
jgi:hypothetical protein